MLAGQKLFREFIRNRCSPPMKIRPLVALDDTVKQNLESGVYKARRHPGINKTKTGTLPQEVLSALEKTTRDYPIKTIVAEGQKLSRYLKNRHPPVEQDVLRLKTQKLRDDFIAKKRIDLESMEEEQRGIKERSIKDNIQKKLKKNIFNWHALKYDQFKALQYLLVRSPGEYAVMEKIFSEIKSRDPSFTPRGFFDFGSGVGSAVWALTSVWDKKDIFEYYLCDPSKDMNELSELILRGGDDNRQLQHKNVNYRQFLPASSDLQFNLVVSAYTLFELDSRETRQKTLQTLWDKCENYLVLVENGTKAGFELITEAREFVLQYDKDNATVFSPCPHDKSCPRLAANDGTPCNFVVNYHTTGIGSTMSIQKDLYSYVVIKKGPKKQENPEDGQEWPRIVRPVLVRKKHSICRMCTKHGKLQEVIFCASKHGKTTYHCARSSEWGDRLPVEIAKEVGGISKEGEEETLESVDRETDLK